ncbi:serine/threonine-protein kinase [Agarilytica rhodophyticola]|uniref:serine/threonine-protein kinase n=1 Tax=Agarilytica rhodophyticola TaxID=1737490 RepID=UPI000B3438B3|nr:serine/threonine-protein kinase [Agarilytica rhodophyticola]
MDKKTEGRGASHLPLTTVNSGKDEPDSDQTVVKTGATVVDDKTRVKSSDSIPSSDATRVKTPSSQPTKVEGATSTSSQTKLRSPQTLAGNQTSSTTGLSELADAPITKIERMERTPRPTGSHREIDVGSVIRDRFVLQEVLGRGGMGAVYRALDLIKKEAGDDKPYIAIKLLTGGFRDHPHAFVTLQREARKTQELAHPNIVTVYDFDREEDVVYLTMEQLSGAPLIDVIKGKTNKFLDDKEKLDIIEQIAKGLAYAHTKGIVHSDLKPANIFLTDDGVIKILDFGIARAANKELYQDSFDAGQLGALTLSYASPEMIRFEPPHPCDDIYALGIIICEIMGGPHPFDRKDAKTAFEEKLSPKIPEIKNPFLKKCLLDTLSLERDSRIPDASVFLKRFNNANSAPKRIASITAIIVLAIIANFFYIQTIEVESVPFSSLPKEQQTQFYELLEQGNTALKFKDMQGAVAKFNSAFEIHGTNDDIKKAKKKVVAIFKENLDKAGDEKSKEFLKSQLNDLKRYPAFADLDEL